MLSSKENIWKTHWIIWGENVPLRVGDTDKIDNIPYMNTTPHENNKKDKEF